MNLVSPDAPNNPVNGVNSQCTRSTAAPQLNEGFKNILCREIRCCNNKNLSRYSSIFEFATPLIVGAFFCPAARDVLS